MSFKRNCYVHKKASSLVINGHLPTCVILQRRAQPRLETVDRQVVAVFLPAVGNRILLRCGGAIDR